MLNKLLNKLSNKLLLVGILIVGLLLLSCSRPSTESQFDPKKPLEGMTIVLDPGHGEGYPGEKGAGGEAEVVHSIAEKLKILLQNDGAGVYITPSYFDRWKRAEYANSKKADIFVSIHANGNNNWNINGVESFYGDFGANREDDKKLCEKLHPEIVNVLYSQNRGVKSGDYTVLLNTNMPACLVEIEFISCMNIIKYKGITYTGYKDLMESENYQTAVAEAFHKGIANYFFNQLSAQEKTKVYSVLSEEQKSLLEPVNMPELGLLGAVVIIIGIGIIFLQKKK